MPITPGGRSLWRSVRGAVGIGTVVPAGPLPFWGQTFPDIAGSPASCAEGSVRRRRLWRCDCSQRRFRPELDQDAVVIVVVGRLLDETAGEVNEGEAADRQVFAGAGREAGQCARVAAGEDPGFDGLIPGGERDGVLDGGTLECREEVGDGSQDFCAAPGDLPGGDVLADAVFGKCGGDPVGVE